MARSSFSMPVQGFDFSASRSSASSVPIRSKFLNHPGVCAGYRIYTPAGSVVYMPDNEPFEQLDVQLRNRGVENTARKFKSPAEERADLIEFLRGTDLLIVDAQYTDEE